MAKKDENPEQIPVGTIALDEGGVILINAGASRLDVQDKIDEQLKQLRAMLVITYGEDVVPLGTMPDDLQNDYIWAMARKVRLIQVLLELMMLPADHGQETDS